MCTACPEHSLLASRGIDDERVQPLVSSCMTGPDRFRQILGLGSNVDRDWSVYAIADLGTCCEILLEGADIEFAPAVALALTEHGLRWMWVGCGPADPAALMQPGNTPDFLLPPPTEDEPASATSRPVAITSRRSRSSLSSRPQQSGRPLTPVPQPSE